MLPANLRAAADLFPNFDFNGFQPF